MSVIQYVNLPQTDKFAEASGKKKERLDFIRIKVKFQKSNMSGFRLECKCLGGSEFEWYEDNERARNQGFQVRGMPRVLTNDGKTEAKYNYDSHLNAAGGNEYEYEATHKGKLVKSSAKIVTRRMLFYQTFVMVDPDGGTLNDADTTPMETELKGTSGNKYNIDVIKKADLSQIEFIKCYHDRNTWDVIKGVAKEYELDDLDPYAFGIAFINYISDPRDYPVDRDVTGLVSGLSTSNRSFEVEFNKYLWFQMDDQDDTDKRWYKELRLEFTPSDSSGSPSTITVSPDSVDSRVRPSGSDLHSFGGRHKLKIFLTPARIQNSILNKQGTWKLKGEIRTVKSFTNGSAFRGINLILVATRVRWENRNLGDVPATITHEVGHKIGMVAHGDRGIGDKIIADMFSLDSETASAGWRAFDSELSRKMKLPNSHDKLYGENRGVNDRGHRGPHCGEGASWSAANEEWTGTPGCVMFGASMAGRPGTFCGKCAKLVRKLDLSGKALTTGGFKTSMAKYSS
jgi:hypothetical protein